IQRVGADRTSSHVDVRVIAATNRDPQELVANKTFREDLYYRLNVIDIRISPLRARRGDIPLLFEHFIRRYAVGRGIAPPRVAADAMAALMAFDWPGNVRQLKNLAERLITRAQRSIITRADLPPEMTGETRTPSPPSAAPVARAPIEAVFERMVKDRESFWSAVYPAFMTRDLTRADLRFIVRRGLQETAGSYKLLVELLNMQPTDYKRFLNFL